MSTYTLLNSANNSGSLPPVPVIRPVKVTEQNTLAVLTGNLMDPTLSVTPPTEQAFQLTVTGTAGAVSASAQIYGSNDNKNWIRIGAPVTASGTITATVGALGTVPYAFYGALLTALSGTNATATMTMSC